MKTIPLHTFLRVEKVRNPNVYLFLNDFLDIKAKRKRNKKAAPMPVPNKMPTSSSVKKWWGWETSQ